MPFIPSRLLPFRRALPAGGRLLTLLTLALSALLTGRALAENPWSSSAMDWSNSSYGRGGSSQGWSSWDSTSGGTFGNPDASHHFNRSAPSVTVVAPPTIVHSAPRVTIAPPRVAPRDSQIDPVMLKAASIAEQHALSRGTSRCWHYVKEALVAAGGVSSYPQTAYARDAGRELVAHFGFSRLHVHSAESAPVGAVLVYGGPGAGHVELRTAHGYASDYRAPNPSFLPFLGAYARLAGRHHSGETAQVTLAVAPGL